MVFIMKIACYNQFAFSSCYFYVSSLHICIKMIQFVQYLYNKMFLSDLYNFVDIETFEKGLILWGTSVMRPFGILYVENVIVVVYCLESVFVAHP